MNKYNWDYNQIKNAVENSINFTEVLLKINIPRQGNNTKTLRRFLDLNNIDYSHFTGRARNYNTVNTDISLYLVENSSIKSAKLKEKLLKHGILEYKCSRCGLFTWLGSHITLLLHHIDGNPKNNQLSNLQLLCPNCHSQTENYCGNANRTVKNTCPDCGKAIAKYSTYCPVCASKHNRKVERPSKELLLCDFETLISYRKIGQKYSVTDNTVRKWCKYYNIELKTKL